MLIGSALMVNLRRIRRYQTTRKQQEADQSGQEKSPNWNDYPGIVQHH